QKATVLWKDQEPSIHKFYSGDLITQHRLIRLQPGSDTSLAVLHGGGRILGIELKPPKAFEGDFKQIDLKITWDEENTPAVNVPVADFFGYAYGTRSMESLLLGATQAK